MTGRAGGGSAASGSAGSGSTLHRRVTGVGVAALMVQAVVFLLLMTGRPPLLLPITATLGGDRMPLTTVDLGLAVILLPPLATLALAPGLAGREGVGRALEATIVAPVVVFLVACLNGITEVAALVPIYALASGAAALIALEPVRSASRRRLSLAAAIGIVPWGVIAFTQVGSLLVGDAPPAAVRVLTLVLLAAAITTFVLEWRMRRGGRDHTIALLTTSVLAMSVLGWFTVGRLYP